MPVLIDNLAALVVGTVVVLILLAVQQRSGAETVDRTTVAAGWRVAQATTQVVEDDFVNLGAGVDHGPVIVSFSDGSDPAEPAQITFRRKVYPKDDPNTSEDEAGTDAERAALPVVTITYAVVPAGALTDGEATYPLVRLVRTQSDKPGETWESAALLAYEHALAGRDGTALAPDEVGDAAGVRVAFQLARGSRVRDAEASRVGYDRTFFPAALREPGAAERDPDNEDLWWMNQPGTPPPGG